MAAGWFRDTSDNKLVAAADSELTPPTGHDFILKSTIEAVYAGEIWQLGTWDGSTYVPPADIIVPYDQTTDSGMVQLAAHVMMDVFEAGLEFLENNRLAWQHDGVVKTQDAIQWQMVNAARVALNSTRTAANRVKFLEEAASWPTGFSGEVAQFADWFAEGTPTAATKDWSWVNPETDPPSRTAATMWPMGFMNATNVENAPTSASLIGRDWINDIP